MHVRLGLPIAALVVLLLAAAPAPAAPTAKVSGSAIIGSVLTASIKGGKPKSVRWERCRTSVAKGKCPKTVRVDAGPTHVIAAGEVGAFLRAIVTPKTGKPVRSAWVGPVAVLAGGGSSSTGGGGGAGGGGTPTGVGGGPPTPMPNTPAGGMTGQAAIDRFYQLVAGSKMYRLQLRDVSGVSGRTTWDLRWCSNRTTFSWISENRRGSSSSLSEAAVSYRVTQATFNAAGTLGEGTIEYRASPGDTALGPSGRATIRLGASVAWIDGLANRFDWTARGAGC